MRAIYRFFDRMEIAVDAKPRILRPSTTRSFGTRSSCNEVAIVRIQRLLMVLAICSTLSWTSGCANRNAYNPYPQQYQQPYQAYPYTGQPGQPIQPSPPVGVPLSANGMQPGYGPPPGTFVQGQPPNYPILQPAQPNPGYYNPQLGQPNQPNQPFLGR